MVAVAAVAFRGAIVLAIAVIILCGVLPSTFALLPIGVRQPRDPATRARGAGRFRRMCAFAALATPAAPAIVYVSVGNWVEARRTKRRGGTMRATRRRSRRQPRAPATAGEAGAAVGAHGGFALAFEAPLEWQAALVAAGTLTAAVMLHAAAGYTASPDTAAGVALLALAARAARNHPSVAHGALLARWCVQGPGAAVLVVAAAAAVYGWVVANAAVSMVWSFSTDVGYSAVTAVVGVGRTAGAAAVAAARANIPSLRPGERQAALVAAGILAVATALHAAAVYTASPDAAAGAVLLALAARATRNPTSWTRWAPLSRWCAWGPGAIALVVAAAVAMHSWVAANIAVSMAWSLSVRGGYSLSLRPAEPPLSDPPVATRARRLRHGNKKHRRAYARRQRHLCGMRDREREAFERRREAQEPGEPTIAEICTSLRGQGAATGAEMALRVTHLARNTISVAQSGVTFAARAVRSIACSRGHADRARKAREVGTVFALAAGLAKAASDEAAWALGLPMAAPLVGLLMEARTGLARATDHAALTALEAAIPALLAADASVADAVRRVASTCAAVPAFGKGAVVSAAATRARWSRPAGTRGGRRVRRATSWMAVAIVAMCGIAHLSLPPAKPPDTLPGLPQTPQPQPPVAIDPLPPAPPPQAVLHHPPYAATRVGEADNPGPDMPRMPTAMAMDKLTWFRTRTAEECAYCPYPSLVSLPPESGLPARFADMWAQLADRATTTTGEDQWCAFKAITLMPRMLLTQAPSFGRFFKGKASRRGRRGRRRGGLGAPQGAPGRPPMDRPHRSKLGIHARFEAFRQGNFEELWEPVEERSRKRRTNHTPCDGSLRSDLLAKVQAGEYSRAVKLLCRSALAASTESTLAALESLHPGATAADHHTQWRPLPTLDDTAQRSEEDEDAFAAELEHIVRTLPTANGADAAQLRYEHVRMLHDHAPDALGNFVRFLLEGRCPLGIAEWFFAGRLVALDKGGDDPTAEVSKRKVRPIAVGAAYAQVASRMVIARNRPELCGLLNGERPFPGAAQAPVIDGHPCLPVQAGVNVPNGVEIMHHSAQELLAAHPEWAQGVLDMKNAFNSIHRASFRDTIQEAAPGAYPWVYTLYASTESRLFFPMDGADPGLIHSARGVRQGDPLGPVLFAIGLHPVLRALQAEVHKRGHHIAILAYLDDANLFGTPEALACAFRLLQGSAGEAHELGSVGLELQPLKCSVWAPWMAAPGPEQGPAAQNESGAPPPGEPEVSPAQGTGDLRTMHGRLWAAFSEKGLRPIVRDAFHTDGPMTGTPKQHEGHVVCGVPFGTVAFQRACLLRHIWGDSVPEDLDLAVGTPSTSKIECVAKQLDALDDLLLRAPGKEPMWHERNCLIRACVNQRMEHLARRLPLAVGETAFRHFDALLRHRFMMALGGVTESPHLGPLGPVVSLPKKAGGHGLRAMHTVADAALCGSWGACHRRVHAWFRPWLRHTPPMVSDGLPSDQWAHRGHFREAHARLAALAANHPSSMDPGAADANLLLPPALRMAKPQQVLPPLHGFDEDGGTGEDGPRFLGHLQSELSLFLHARTYTEALRACRTEQGRARMVTAPQSRMVHLGAIPALREPSREGQGRTDPSWEQPPAHAPRMGYKHPEDYCIDLCLDLCITAPHLRGQLCAMCRPTDGRGPHHWDGDPEEQPCRAPPGGLHYIKCPHGMLSQSRDGCLHNAVQAVVVAMAKKAYQPSIRVDTSYGSNRGSASSMWSPKHAADILVRGAGENGGPLHVEITTLAAEGATLAPLATTSHALHVHRAKTRATRDYESLKGMTGSLCVFAVDTRGGLGPDFDLEVQGGKVRITGAEGFLRKCAESRHPDKPGIDNRWARAAFTRKWRMRIATAARLTMVDMVRHGAAAPSPGPQTDSSAPSPASTSGSESAIGPVAYHVRVLGMAVDQSAGAAWVLLDSQGHFLAGRTALPAFAARGNDARTTMSLEARALFDALAAAGQADARRGRQGPTPGGVLVHVSSGALRHALTCGKQDRLDAGALEWARRRLGNLAVQLRGGVRISREDMPAQVRNCLVSFARSAAKTMLEADIPAQRCAGACFMEGEAAGRPVQGDMQVRVLPGITFREDTGGPAPRVAPIAGIPLVQPDKLIAAPPGERRQVPPSSENRRNGQPIPGGVVPGDPLPGLDTPAAPGGRAGSGSPAAPPSEQDGRRGAGRCDAARPRGAETAQGPAQLTPGAQAASTPRRAAAKRPLDDPAMGQVTRGASTRAAGARAPGDTAKPQGTKRPGPPPPLPSDDLALRPVTRARAAAGALLLSQAAASGPKGGRRALTKARPQLRSAARQDRAADPPASPPPPEGHPAGGGPEPRAARGPGGRAPGVRAAGGVAPPSHVRDGPAEERTVSKGTKRPAPPSPPRNTRAGARGRGLGPPAAGAGGPAASASGGVPRCSLAEVAPVDLCQPCRGACGEARGGVAGEEGSVLWRGPGGALAVGAPVRRLDWRAAFAGTGATHTTRMASGARRGATARRPELGRAPAGSVPVHPSGRWPGCVDGGAARAPRLMGGAWCGAAVWRPEPEGAPAGGAPAQPPTWCLGRAGGGAPHVPRLMGGARWGAANVPGTPVSSTWSQAALALGHPVGGDDGLAGLASAPAPPPLRSPAGVGPPSQHHHTTCRSAEGSACDGAAGGSCGGPQPEAGGPPAQGGPFQSPAGRAGGGASHGHPRAAGAGRGDALGLPGTPVGGTLCCAAPAPSPPLFGGAAVVAVLARAAAPSPRSLAEVEPPSQHHHTTCRSAEGSACDGAAGGSCGGPQPEAGGPPAQGVPFQSPAGRAGGGASHEHPRAAGAGRGDARGPPGTPVGGTLCCAAPAPSPSLFGGVAVVAVLARAAAPPPRSLAEVEPSSTHPHTPYRANSDASPHPPGELCVANSGEVPSLSGHTRYRYQSPKSTPACDDGPAHVHPDDGVARTNSAAHASQQCHAFSGVVKPVCRLPDPPARPTPK